MSSRAAGVHFIEKLNYFYVGALCCCRCSVSSASALPLCLKLCSVLALVYDLVLLALLRLICFSCLAPVLLLLSVKKEYITIQCRSAPEAMQRVCSCSALVSVSSASAVAAAMQHTCSCVIFFSCLALFLKLCSMCALCVSVAAPCDVQRACSAALCSIDFFINTLSILSEALQLPCS